MEDFYTTGHENEFIYYGLDKYPDRFFDYFVDIGGCYGTISFMIALRHPNSKIFCYEPSEDDYKEMAKKSLVFPNIMPINEALGDGSDLFFEKRQVGQHTFAEEGDGFGKKSRTLKDIFDINGINIDSRYGLKIDCEGGERYLIGDKDSEEIIRRSSHLCMEVHFNHEKLKKNLWFKTLPHFIEYDNWIRNNFSDTHNIKYWHSKKQNGHGIYVLDNKSNIYEII